MNDSQSPTTNSIFTTVNLREDLTSGLVVFLVALPLCLGIALASGAPLYSGLLAGIIGGIVVGSLSGSHTSVAGPAAGLFAIVAVQIDKLGSFETFLLAVMLAGLIQIGLGIARAGELSSFFPSSVIKGLLAAIGVILILKQIPHVVGHDSDPEGEMSFSQPDEHNTFSEIGTLFQGEIHYGATVVGLTSIALLVIWARSKFLKSLVIPGPLVVVITGVLLQAALSRFGEGWHIGSTHLVQIPTNESLRFPDLSSWNNPGVYLAAVTIAIVASLETLLNLEAVDKLDPLKRRSPPNRELLAQGVGNVVAGSIGALPMTSVIVRSSVNISSGGKTKRSAVFHGILLLTCVQLFPQLLNRIPLAALGGILLVTGVKLANPKLFRQIWSEGKHQFIPFMTTLVAIVFTDLLIGILIGLAVSVLFILQSNLKRPIRRIVEKHVDGDVVHVELASQVSFLNRAALDRLFKETEPGTHLLIDATDSHYIDPDILALIREFRDTPNPKGIKVSLRGFRDKYLLQDEIQYADYSTRDLRERATPEQVLKLLRDGNERFQNGSRVTRDFKRQVGATAAGQNPLAAVLSCIDSRVPAELVFDLGIGDIFSVRVAGNVIGTKSLGSLEYGVAVAGVKLVLVLGHTRCGAVTSSVDLIKSAADVHQETGCAHLNSIVAEIGDSFDAAELENFDSWSEAEKEAYVDNVAKRNVLRTVDEITRRSQVTREASEAGTLLVVGAIYDVSTGQIRFVHDPSASPEGKIAQLS